MREGGGAGGQGGGGGVHPSVAYSVTLALSRKTIKLFFTIKI